jgi:hypothetical protein
MPINTRSNSAAAADLAALAASPAQVEAALAQGPSVQEASSAALPSDPAAAGPQPSELQVEGGVSPPSDSGTRRRAATSSPVVPSATARGKRARGARTPSISGASHAASVLAQAVAASIQSEAAPGSPSLRAALGTQPSSAGIHLSPLVSTAASWSPWFSSGLVPPAPLPQPRVVAIPGPAAPATSPLSRQEGSLGAASYSASVAHSSGAHIASIPPLSGPVSRSLPAIPASGAHIVTASAASDALPFNPTDPAFLEAVRVAFDHLQQVHSAGESDLRATLPPPA